MSATEKDIEINIDDLDKKVDDGAKKIDVALKDDVDKKVDLKRVVAPEEGLEMLKKQLNEERTLRLRAQQVASEAASGEASAKKETQDTQLHLVTSAIDTVTQSIDALEGQLAEASAAGDHVAIAKATRLMNEKIVELQTLKKGEVALKEAPKPVPREVQSDPVEKFCSTLTPTSASWVRAHPEYVRDANKNRKMMAAHEIALADGTVADSPEYFRSIEATLNIKAQEEERLPGEDPLSGAADASRDRGRAPPSAPVSRSGNGSGQRAGTITLTPAEVQMAEACGQTPEEYARAKLLLRKEGRLNS